MALIVVVVVLVNSVLYAETTEYTIEEFNTNDSLSYFEMCDLNDVGQVVGLLRVWSRDNQDAHIYQYIWDLSGGLKPLWLPYDSYAGHYFTPVTLVNQGLIMAYSGFGLIFYSEGSTSEIIRFPVEVNSGWGHPWTYFSAHDLAENGDVALTLFPAPIIGRDTMPHLAYAYRSASGELEQLSELTSNAVKVSPNGMVAGHIYPDSGPSKAVVWPGPSFLAPGYASYVNDMNKLAWVCGLHVAGPNGGYKPYVSWVNPDTKTRAFQRLPLLPGYQEGSAEVINDNGLIMGYMWNGSASIYAQWKKNKAGIYHAESLQEQFGELFEYYYSRIGANAGQGLALKALNNSGQILLNAPGYPQDAIPGYSVLLTPKLVEIAVDANRDGITRFSSESENQEDPSQSDDTRINKPFRFWINEDWDSSGEEKVPNKPAFVPNDSSDNLIKSSRDLEDFSRLAIKLTPELKSKLLNGYQLHIETRGAPRIKFYRAAPTVEETNYLTSPGVASAQTKEPYRIALVPQKEIRPTAKEYTKGRMLILWEGVAVGKGEIMLKLVSPGGIVESYDTAYVSLHSIRDFFDHVRMTPEKGFPPPYGSGETAPALGWEYVHTRSLPHTEDEQKDMVVFVHGWRMPVAEKQNWSEMFYKRLWHAGYKGRYAAFSWPALAADSGLVEGMSNGFFTYNPSEHRGFKAGVVLDDYLGNLKSLLPSDTRIGVVAHSMGNVAVGEALRLGAAVDNYVMLQAAVSASCWDPHERLFVKKFTDMESGENRTPDWASEWGYRGAFAGIRGVKVVNFYNEQDFALRTGSDQLLPDLGFGGLWEANNILFKPQNLVGLIQSRQYGYFGNIPGIYRLQASVLYKLKRQLHDPHESMAFLARSRTRAVGGERRAGFMDNQPIPGQAIRGRVNLNGSPFQFNAEAKEHSAQFTRPIQEAMIGKLGFYKLLLSQLNSEN